MLSNLSFAGKGNSFLFTGRELSLFLRIMLTIHITRMSEMKKHSIYHANPVTKVFPSIITFPILWSPSIEIFIFHSYFHIRLSTCKKCSSFHFRSIG